MRPAIFVLALAACSNLPDYKPVCGNGVIEPHEDCDSGSGCFQCSQSCDASLGCPIAMACGGDFICHAPGGRFRTMGQTLPFDGKDVFVADVDRDRVGDLVEVTPTAVTVLHGQLGVGPTSESILQTPFVTGPPAIGSFDGDAITDVVLPTVHGIVAYTSTQHALSPYPFALDVSLPRTDATAYPYNVWPLDQSHMGMIMRLTFADTTHVPPVELDYVTIDITVGSPKFSAARRVCASLDPNTIAGVAVRPLSATQQLVAIGDSSNGCVLRIDKGTTFDVGYEAALAGTGGRLVAAAMPNAACPSVFSGTLEWKGATVTGGCGIDTASGAAANPQLAASMPGGDVVIGAVPLVPPLTGMGAEGIATTHAIYALPTTATDPAAPIYASDRELTRTLALDIDGDGDQDIVAISEQMNDLDVLFRFEPVQLPMQPPPMDFQLVRYDTTARPRLMLAGDFDGNHIPDLAYSEPVTYGERVLVMYGTLDRPLPPVEMATFKKLITLLPGNLEVGDASQTLQDLSVLDFDESTNRPLLTLMHGSPQRTLYPAFQPNLGSVQNGTPPPPFVSVAMGHFGAVGGALADLFSVAQVGTSMQAFFTPATDGAFPIGNGQPLTTIDCSSTASFLCGGDIHYLTWPLSMTRDTLIAVNAAQQAVTVDPSMPAAAQADQTLFDAPFPTGVVLHSLQHIDLDGDGHDELIASFGIDPAQRMASAMGTVRACQVDSSGVVEPGSCVDLANSVEDGPAVCVDAAVAHATELQIATTTATTQPPPSLLLLCHEGGASDVLRVSHDKAGYHTARVLHINSQTVERIFTGDVTGDAVDDLIALDVSHDFLVPQLTIYPQCTSRDTDADCERSP